MITDRSQSYQHVILSVQRQRPVFFLKSETPICCLRFARFVSPVPCCRLLSHFRVHRPVLSFIADLNAKMMLKNVCQLRSVHCIQRRLTLLSVMHLLTFVRLLCDLSLENGEKKLLDLMHRYRNLDTFLDSLNRL